MEKGLRAELDHYERRFRWVPRVNDWNQVCNSGLVAGPLAIADEEPDLARKIILGSRKSIENSMASYAPDGGWNEGPVYWRHGTDHFVRYIAALESALGTGLGCRRAQGFSETSLFRIHTTGPLGAPFNFADANERLWQAPHMYWLAQAFRRPEHAAHERDWFLDRPEIFDLIWSGAGERGESAAELARDKLFRGVEVACFRSAWNDRNALYVGFKGAGSANNGHSHLDAGSFVLDWQGQRWALDRGMERYQVPGYFGPQRWKYFSREQPFAQHAHNRWRYSGSARRRAHRRLSVHSPARLCGGRPERRIPAAAGCAAARHRDARPPRRADSGRCGRGPAARDRLEHVHPGRSGKAVARAGARRGGSESCACPQAE